MDVSCPRCKTEYEFDDERVPDNGVTVKCTSCNHVFRVRKKSAPPASLSGPSKPSDETLPLRSGQLQAQVREWKVRQPSGNIFSFKELTTLQKWIVERKVSRDDEISLTGEAWKRLGNIAELASFFQIVDDAKKVHELEAQQKLSQQAVPVVPPPPPPPSAPMPGERAGMMPAFEGTPPPRPRAHEAPTLPPEDDREGRKKLTETLREPGFVSAGLRGAEDRPPPSYRSPPSQARRDAYPQPDEETIRPVKQGGGAGMWLGVLLVLAGLGGAGGYYFLVWAPEQQRVHEQALLEEKQKADQAAQRRVEEEKAAAAKAEADRKAAEEEAAKKKADEEAKLAAEAAAKDAGATPDKVAGSSDTGAGGGKGEVRHTSDYWINQGDRLRDRERAEAALDAYGKALDITPTNVEALTGKGLCFLDMAKPMLAEPVLEQALKLNPRYAPAIMGLAESYRVQGKKEQAVATYQKYLDSFPNGSEAAVAKSYLERLK